MTPPGPPPATPAFLPAPRRGRWQVGLRTVLLLTAAVAVWLTYALERRRSADLTTRIAVLSPLARELVVDDPGRIAVVQREPLWYDENRWDVHLPASRRYRLCLATRGIAMGLYPPVAASAPLTAGRHVIALDQVQDSDGWRVDGECDGTRLVSVREPKGWNPGSRPTGGDYYDYPASVQLPPLPGVILFHRRSMEPRDDQGRPAVPDGPTDGVMLWIEPDADGAAPAPAAR
jgi:hypothetical protein